MFDLMRPEILTRQDVRVNRAHGWIERKDGCGVVGMVTADKNAAGQPIFRAHAGDVGSFAFTREDAVTVALNLHNMQEKARAWELADKMAARR